MATPASRRLATAVLAGLIVLPSGLLLAVPAFAEDPSPEAGVGEPAYEEAVPDPVTGLYPGQYVPATESSPATPGWITGGTLQEGTATVAKPVAKPVAKSATASVAQPAAEPAARPAARTASTGSATVRAPRRTIARTSATPGGPTVLPFTGPGRLEAQLGFGAGLVLLGCLVSLAARPRSRRHAA